MFSKIEKNYFLDILVGIVGFACIITGLIIDIRPQAFLGVFGIIKNLHIWAGYAAVVLVSLHILWHFAWLQAMTSSVIRSPQKRWVAILCVVTALAFCVSAVFSTPTGRPQHAPGKVAAENK